jgi:hypothetical protein
MPPQTANGPYRTTWAELGAGAAVLTDTLTATTRLLTKPRTDEQKPFTVNYLPDGMMAAGGAAAYHLPDQTLPPATIPMPQLAAVNAPQVPEPQRVDIGVRVVIDPFDGRVVWAKVEDTAHEVAAELIVNERRLAKSGGRALW